MPLRLVHSSETLMICGSALKRSSGSSPASSPASPLPDAIHKLTRLYQEHPQQIAAVVFVIDALHDELNRTAAPLRARPHRPRSLAARLLAGARMLPVPAALTIPAALVLASGAVFF